VVVEEAADELDPRAKISDTRDLDAIDKLLQRDGLRRVLQNIIHTVKQKVPRGGTAATQWHRHGGLILLEPAPHCAFSP